MRHRLRNCWPRIAILFALFLPTLALIYAPKVRAQFGRPSGISQPPRFPRGSTQPPRFPGADGRNRFPRSSGIPDIPDPTRTGIGNRTGSGRFGSNRNSGFQYVWSCSGCKAELGRGRTLLEKPSYGSCPHCNVQFINGGGIGSSRLPFTGLGMNDVPGRNPGSGFPGPNDGPPPFGCPGPDTAPHNRPNTNVPPQEQEEPLQPERNNPAHSGSKANSNKSNDEKKSSVRKRSYKLPLFLLGGLIVAGGTAAGIALVVRQNNQKAKANNRPRRRPRRLIDDDYHDDDDRPRSRNRRRF